MSAQDGYAFSCFHNVLRYHLTLLSKILSWLRHSESLLAVTKPQKPQPLTSMPSPSRRTWIWLVSQHAFIVTVHICMLPCPLCPYYVYCMHHAPKYICLICVFVREFTIQCPFVCAFIRPFHDTFRVFYIFLFFLKQTD
ncbi:hypothetical protein B0H14DRAFT_3048372 [Mycena olivaceomarginata]|nr:hypothetical protein B0H14DRAFT_3048372 [Mycena olivaceomarginata]